MVPVGRGSSRGLLLGREAPVNEVMLQDIQDQPNVLATAVPTMRSQVSELPSRLGSGRVILTGSGDSLIAAVAVEQLYGQHLPTPVRAMPALDAGRYVDWQPDDLAIVISVSGEVSRAVEVAVGARAAGSIVLAVTSGADSSLASAATAVVAMPPPLDRSIPHCRDYTLTLAALGILLERLSLRELPELQTWVDAVGPAVTRSLQDAAVLPPILGRAWFLGAGPDRATAMYGAMKFWEAAGLQAWWDDLEEFAHGSHLMALPGDHAYLIADRPGLGRAQEMASGLRRMGLLPVTISPAGVQAGDLGFTTTRIGGTAWHPFVACFPMQALSYYEATRRGLDVAVPLDGQAHGALFEGVHREWTKGSRITNGPEASGHY